LGCRRAAKGFGGGRHLRREAGRRAGWTGPNAARHLLQYRYCLSGSALAWGRRTRAFPTCSSGPDPPRNPRRGGKCTRNGQASNNAVGRLAQLAVKGGPVRRRCPACSRRPSRSGSRGLADWCANRAYPGANPCTAPTSRHGKPPATPVANHPTLWTRGLARGLARLPRAGKRAHSEGNLP
jgi:hypothetical protein